MVCWNSTSPIPKPPSQESPNCKKRCSTARSKSSRPPPLLPPVRVRPPATRSARPPLYWWRLDAPTEGAGHETSTAGGMEQRGRCPASKSQASAIKCSNYRHPVAISQKSERGIRGFSLSPSNRQCDQSPRRTDCKPPRRFSPVKRRK